MNLTEMRQKMVQLEADMSIDGIYRPAIPEKHDFWMKSLSETRIPFFKNGDTGVTYNSLRDIKFWGPEIPNQEWKASLNRYAWLTHLAWEYEQTREEHWAEMARDSIEAWMDYRHFTGHETLDDVWPSTGDNCLSVSIRLGQSNLHGWFGTLPYFAGSPFFDEAFIERMRKSAGEQLHFMMQNMTKHGNFRINQLNTLLFLSEILPEYAHYRDFAVCGLNETFRSQVDADGSHCEHTSGYHSWMARVYTDYALLALRRPALGLQIDPERLMKMYEYTKAHFTPDGHEFGMNDSVRWHKDAPLHDVSALHDTVSRLRKLFHLPEATYPVPSCYPNAGQFFFRHGSDALVLDATRYGSTHCHLARGSLLFYHGDRLQLCDPGSLTYERSDPFYHHGRLTPLHNTVTVNNWGQIPQSNAEVPVFRDTEHLSFAICRYNGGYSSYVNVQPKDRFSSIQSCAARHLRTLLWIKGKFAVVYDFLEAFLPEYDYAAHWQFLDENVEMTVNGLHTLSDGANLLVCCPWSNLPVKEVLYNGDREKMLGFIAAGAGSQCSGGPAPCLSTEGHAVGMVKPQMLHVLVPYDGETVPEVSAEVSEIDETIQISVNVSGETYKMAAEESLLRETLSASMVGFMGELKTDARAILQEPDGSVYELK